MIPSITSTWHTPMPRHEWGQGAKFQTFFMVFTMGNHMQYPDPRSTGWSSYGYGSIPIDTFLGEWTSIYQLFWCSPGVQGFDTLPYISHKVLGLFFVRYFRTHLETEIGPATSFDQNSRMPGLWPSAKMMKEICWSVPQVPYYPSIIDHYSLINHWIWQEFR